MKPLVHSHPVINPDFNLDADFSESVEIWVDYFCNLPSNAKKKIFVAMEPDEISNIKISLSSRHALFDYILTFDEQLLNTLPNAILFEYGTAWIWDYPHPQKKFAISMVCGNKLLTRGHSLRHIIWHNQLLIKTPIDFFISSRGGVPNIKNNPILGESKNPLFDSMFHISIENVSKKYYFSEKLIDCLLAKTIPIYWGCTNINEYFNTEGILVAADEYEIIKYANSLTEEDYFKRKDAIDENYHRAQHYIDYRERLINKLAELNIK